VQLVPHQFEQTRFGCHSGGKQRDSFRLVLAVAAAVAVVVVERPADQQR